MVSVNESKIFCLYCRGEITYTEDKKVNSLQTQQYHKECFEEIIKDNHCEYCSELLNELNSYFTEQQVKIHQKCYLKINKILSQKMSSKVKEYLQELPLKKLAKDYAFYEMKEEKFTTYAEELQEHIKKELPDYSAKSGAFQNFLAIKFNEILQEEIAGYIKGQLQIKFDNELKNCRTDSKKDIVHKTLEFVWRYYLEVPISYKDRINHKILPKPSLDSVNCTIFYFKLEKLFRTGLDFNNIVNNNYNEVADYLLGQPVSLVHLKI